MTHLDDATVLQVRDREPLDSGLLEHARACDECEGAVVEARDRAAFVERTLAILDQPVDVEGAKAAVRARLDATREAGARRRTWTGHLGRAAAILLLAAGAVWALPGSPLRTFWRNDAGEDAPALAHTSTSGQSAEPSGITVPVPDGRIRVVVREAMPGSELSIVWGDAATARITAPAGSRFTYGSGQAEVVPGPGDVTVELPRSATATSVDVNGSTYLSGSAERPVTSGPVIETTAGRIRFRVPGG